MEIWKFAAFAIVCALLCAVLKQHGAGQASLLALAGCVGLLLTAMTVLTPVMTFLRRLASLAGVNPALLAPVLKAAAVGLLTQLTESPKFSKLANINDARAFAYAYVDMRQVEAFLYMLSPMPLNFSC